MANTAKKVEPIEGDVITNDSQVAEYSDTEAALAKFRDVANFVPDMSSKESYQKSKDVSLEITTVLTSLETKREALKKPLLDRGRLIDKEAKRIKAALTELRLPHQEAYRAKDKEREERLKQLNADIDAKAEWMRGLPVAATTASSDAVEAMRAELMAQDCSDCYHRSKPMLELRNSTDVTLNELYDAAIQREKDAELARVEAERIAEAERVAKVERDRQQAELDKQREALEAKEREQREEAEKLEAQRKQQEEAAAEIARQKQAAIDEENRQEQLAKQRAEDKKKAEEDAKRREAEAVEIERQRVAKEKADKEEDDRKRAADLEHKKAINDAALKALVDGGVPQAKAKLAVTLIAAGDIPNIRIQY